MSNLLPMPTVDQLVQVFRERNWTPTRQVGASPTRVQRGECCAVPALCLMADPHSLDELDKFEDAEPLYRIVREHYGPYALHIVSGFDNYPLEGMMVRYPVNNAISNWYALGTELYRALTKRESNDD